MKHKVYMVASIMGKYMFPLDGTIYMKKSTAEKKCKEVNDKLNSDYIVVCADNWYDVANGEN